MMPMTRLAKAQSFMWGGGRGRQGRMIMIGIIIGIWVVSIPLSVLFGSTAAVIGIVVYLTIALSIVVRLAESSPGWKQRYPAKPGR